MGLSRVHIALGGNLGDVKNSFIRARSDIEALEDTHVTLSSELYRTAPVGPAGQPDYLNAVIEITTSKSPDELLANLHQIENAHGRIREERWGARTLDLDILTYEGVQLATETLTIPHAMISERMFVLCPLCDIAPRWQHPLLEQTAAQLMHQLIAKGEPSLPKGEVW